MTFLSYFRGKNKQHLDDTIVIYDHILKQFGKSTLIFTHKKSTDMLDFSFSNNKDVLWHVYIPTVNPTCWHVYIPTVNPTCLKTRHSLRCKIDQNVKFSL